MQFLENNVQTWDKKTHGISSYNKTVTRFMLNGAIACWCVHWKIRNNEMGSSSLTSILFGQIAVGHKD